MTSNSKTNSVDDMVFNGVMAVLNKHSQSTWVGTMTDLNAAMTKAIGKRQAASLPGSPSALRVVLNRVLNRLRHRKVGVKFARTTDHSRTRYVKFTR